MKSLRFLPLAFLAGQHGFAMFAPYLALVAMIFVYRRGRSAMAAAPAS